QKIKTAKEHLAALCDLKGEYVGIREFRGQAAYYLKGIPRSARTKVALMSATKQAEADEIFDRFLDQYEERQAKHQAVN
ncbi:MAG: tRNA dihydrouridine synthase DusB, partial [Candidatus Limosilactobacillus intestinavium]